MINQDIQDLETGLELLQYDHDDDLEAEIKEKLVLTRDKINDLELISYLSGIHDNKDCILTITAGAGGTDAQDWAEMMCRMYIKYSEKQNFNCQCIQESPGDEAGIKSATFMIQGENAYGLLKHEAGVHRMVRLSPFNANNKRQTSFASVEAMPKIQKSNLEIDTKDLKIDTFRASGAGGQHVNKTDSAVRITHIPTGVVASSQHSRSQHANKETAMELLSSRLHHLLEKEHKEKVNEIKGVHKEISWGNQIRSYVFHPYKLVKDLRSNYETSNINQVMNGQLNPFIRQQLLQKPNESSTL